eukprot:1147211-Pelagomonas_calceolata.AAC.1
MVGQPGYQLDARHRGIWGPNIHVSLLQMRCAVHELEMMGQPGHQLDVRHRGIWGPNIYVSLLQMCCAVHGLEMPAWTSVGHQLMRDLGANKKQNCH